MTNRALIPVHVSALIDEHEQATVDYALALDPTDALPLRVEYYKTRESLERAISNYIKKRNQRVNGE